MGTGFISSWIVMENQATYGISKRGQNTLLYRGFEFWLHRQLKSGSIVWRCCKNRTFKCKAKVIANGLIVVGNKVPEHTHAGNNSRGWHAVRLGL